MCIRDSQPATFGELWLDRAEQGLDKMNTFINNAPESAYNYLTGANDYTRTPLPSGESDRLNWMSENFPAVDRIPMSPNAPGIGSLEAYNANQAAMEQAMTEGAASLAGLDNVNEARRARTVAGAEGVYRHGTGEPAFIQQGGRTVRNPKATAVYSNEVMYDDANNFSAGGVYGSPDEPGDPGYYDYASDTGPGAGLTDAGAIRGSAAYDLYNKEQMEQVAANEKASDELARYDASQKELSDINTQRIRLQHERAAGRINSRRFVEGMTKLGGLAGEAQARMMGDSPADEERARSRTMNAEANQSIAATQQAAQKAQVKQSQASGQAAAEQFLAEMMMKNRELAQARRLGVGQIAADAFDPEAGMSPQDFATLWEMINAQMGPAGIRDNARATLGRTEPTKEEQE